MTDIPHLDHLWRYRARVEKVIDADTLDVYLDQGFHAYRLERLRLLHCWAPELRGPGRAAGLAAKKWAEDWIAALPVSEWPIMIRTEKSDAFGRYLALVFSTEDWRCLNIEMVAAGHATVVKPLPVPTGVTTP